MFSDTTPSTRSAVAAGLAVLAAFQDDRKPSSSDCSAPQVVDLPQNLPAVIRLDRSSSVGAILYRTPPRAVDVRSPVPSGTGNRRARVVRPFWVVILSRLPNWLL